MAKIKKIDIHDHHISHEWEDACVKSRRFIWLRKKRLSQFSIEKNDKLLDLGCGDGLNISVLKSMGIKNVVGLDMSKNLIKIAKRNNPDIKFFVGLMENLPFENETFSVILVDSVFHHIMDYPNNIKEIRRVLKHGGLLCFIEPHQSVLRRLLDFVSTQKFVKLIPVLNERSIGYLGEKNLMTHWLDTENKFLSQLEKYGFKKNFCKRDLLSIVGEYKKN